MASGDGSQRLSSQELQRAVHLLFGAHGSESAVRFLDELAVAAKRHLARQRVVVRPSHAVVHLARQFVGHDAQEQRLSLMLIDGG